MRAELVLVLMLFLVAPSWASHEAGMVGPYNVSFDVNTTMQYSVIVEEPSSGVTSDGVNFERYNLTVQSTDYFAWIILTHYEKPMLANITANEYIVLAALQGSGADEPNIYQPLIDGQPGILATSDSTGNILARANIKRAILSSRPATRRMDLFARMDSTAGRPTAVSYPPFPGRSSVICFTPCM